MSSFRWCTLEKGTRGWSWGMRLCAAHSLMIPVNTEKLRIDIYPWEAENNQKNSAHGGWGGGRSQGIHQQHTFKLKHWNKVKRRKIIPASCLWIKLNWWLSSTQGTSNHLDQAGCWLPAVHGTLVSWGSSWSLWDVTFFWEFYLYISDSIQYISYMSMYS